MKNDKTFNYDDILSQITDEEIIAYLKQNCEMDDKFVQLQMEKFKQHNDIYEEFKYWFFGFKHGDDSINYAVNEPVTEQGYTASYLNYKFGDKIMPIGIFNLLISLREDKEETLNYIKKCLPNKKFKAIMFLSTSWPSPEELENPFYEEGEEKLQKKNIKKLEKQRKKRLKKIKKGDFNEENPFA